MAIPAHSIIQLLPDGSPGYAMMVRNALVNGLHCAGGGPLGPAEGAMTSLYPGGKFRACFLTDDQLVQGVPCARGGIVQAVARHDVPVELYESGRLKSCLLSADYAGLHRFDRFMQQP